MKKSSFRSAGCFAQMPSTPDLPGEDAIHFGVVEVAQRGGADLARGMDDAGQRRQLGPHGGQQACDVVRIGDIGSDDPEFAAVLFAQRIDALLRGIAGRASAGQHQMPGAVRGQVSGDLQPDRPEPAGHQIRCVSAQFQRRSARLPGPPNQPGNVDRLIAQRDLVFPDGRARAAS